MVVIKQTEEVATPTPPIIAEVLQEFQDIFTTPTILPPHRVHDHIIPLVPGVVPVNTRPYRYSPLHKDEIERQVKDLLSSCLISPNTNPFSSPILLVQKKDGTWRFCVDYRRLNSLTVKNKFPMPSIDKILDELTWSKFVTRLDFKSGFHLIRMDPGR
jgi:hypothetical protein